MISVKHAADNRSPRRYGRIAGLLVLAAASVAVFVVLAGAGGKSDSYDVRAIFENSSGITTGADVRVAGASVGTIKKIFVSRGDKASVILSILDPAFQRFYSDASCRIRLQSLIGEKFIDCNPGSPSNPEAPVDPADSSRHLIGLKNTKSPVDIDELLDAMRDPERERFRVIMNELGVTLTGRGQDLQDIIANFDGTFKELDDVLRILARQNDKLVRLAVDGDATLREMAANRKHITGMFKQADLTNRAVNVKRQELADTLARIPGFLDQLEPTARELKRLSIEAQPIAKAGRESSKNLSTWVAGTNEFAAAANPALKKMGNSLDVFRSKFPVLEPLASDLRTFGQNRASITNIRKLLESFDKQGGYQNLASMALGMVGASNGVDAFGHFTRSLLIVNSTCSLYQQSYSTSCTADFSQGRSTDNSPESSSASSAQTSGTQTSGTQSSGSGSSADAAALDYLLGGER